MTRNFAALGDNVREEQQTANAARARLTRKVRTQELEEEKGACCVPGVRG